MTDSRKVREILPSSEKHKKDKIVNSVSDSNSVDVRAATNSLNKPSKPGSLKMSTTSSTAFQDLPVIHFPISLPQEVVQVDNSINDTSNPTVLDHDNLNSQSHDCNVSFVSSSDEAKESSEADSERISNDLVDSTLISSNIKKLEGADISLLDTIKTMNGNSLTAVDSPRSPTAIKNPVIASTIISKPLPPNMGKVSSKTSPTYSCDMCNVIVNSPAQLTQVIK